MCTKFTAWEIGQIRVIWFRRFWKIPLNHLFYADDNMCYQPLGRSTILTTICLWGLWAQNDIIIPVFYDLPFLVHCRSLGCIIGTCSMLSRLFIMVIVWLTQARVITAKSNVRFTHCSFGLLHYFTSPCDTLHLRLRLRSLYWSCIHAYTRNLSSAFNPSRLAPVDTHMHNHRVTHS